MKRSPLKRKSPLKRTRMKRGKGKGKYASRERAPTSWFDFVRSLGCAIPRIGLPKREHGGIHVAGPAMVAALECKAPMEANHMGDRIAGRSTKSQDRDCVGMCKGHHGQWTEYRGLFAGLTHEQRREYAATCIQYVHDRARRNGVEVPTC
jgi:hypothetical protein